MPDLDALFNRANAAYRRHADITETVIQEAATHRLRYAAPDKMVTVVVDGNGDIQDLTIAPGTLTGAHPQLLANSIQTSLNAVRRAALTRRAKLIAEKLEES